MSFLSGLLVGALLPGGIRYLRDHPDAVRDCVQAIRRAFGR